jgi:hypothetical protein
MTHQELVEQAQNKIHAFVDQNSVPESSSVFKTMVLILLATDVGCSDTLLSKVTGYSRGFIIRRRKRLLDLGVWEKTGPKQIWHEPDEEFLHTATLVDGFEGEILRSSSAPQEIVEVPQEQVTPAPMADSLDFIGPVLPMTQRLSMACMRGRHYDCKTFELGRAYEGKGLCQCICHYDD